jgi:DNA polymerase
VIVALGATAARSLLGPQFRVTKHRGKPVASEWAAAVVATVHPSAVLRAPPAERARAERAFFADIRAVATVIGNTSD